MFTLADLTVDTAARSAVRAGTPLTLSAREYALLEYLIRNKGIITLQSKTTSGTMTTPGFQRDWTYTSTALRKKLDSGRETLHRSGAWAVEEKYETISIKVTLTIWFTVVMVVIPP